MQSEMLVHKSSYLLLLFQFPVTLTVAHFFGGGGVAKGSHEMLTFFYKHDFHFLEELLS